MPKGPELYEPVKYPARTRERRNTVLALMAQQGFITQAQARAAQRTPLVTVPNYGMAPAAQYYVNVVKVQAQRAGVNLNQGGFRIFTALDPALQASAAISLSEGVAEVEARQGYSHPKTAGRGSETEYLQGLVVAMDPATGDVRALVGGRDYAESQFDRAIAPGGAQPADDIAELYELRSRAHAAVGNYPAAFTDQGEYLRRMREQGTLDRIREVAQLRVQFENDQASTVRNVSGITSAAEKKAPSAMCSAGSPEKYRWCIVPITPPAE